MLTDQDVKKIVDVHREVFSTKEEFAVFQDEIRKSFSIQLTSIDSYAKKADTYFQEMVMLAHKVDRHEKWLQQIADKLGIKLEI